MRRLGEALAKTTRLVNTLERRVAVRLSGDLASMQHTLAEREREEHVRIKRLREIGIRLRNAGGSP